MFLCMFEKAIELRSLYILRIWVFSMSSYLHLHSRAYDIEPKYYADGEDAYAMRKDLKSLWEKVWLVIYH